VSKATVTKLFVGGTITVIAGAILAILAVALAFANDVFVMNGSEVTAVRGGTLAWSLLGLGILGGLAVMGGLTAGLISWIGALLNTWQRENKGWFVGLLLLGIFNFGFVAMIAYLVVGPDGTAEGASRSAQAAPRPTPA
jgi:hypothetical protein